MQTKPKITGLTALSLALLVSAGCSGGSGGSGGAAESAGPAPDAGSVQLRVNNNNNNEATLFSIVEGRRERLGSLQPNSSGNFAVSLPREVAQVSLEVRVTTQGRCTTEPVSMKPGDSWPVTIPPSLDQWMACR